MDKRIFSEILKKLILVKKAKPLILGKWGELVSGREKVTLMSKTNQTFFQGSKLEAYRMSVSRAFTLAESGVAFWDRSISLLSPSLLATCRSEMNFKCSCSIDSVVMVSPPNTDI
jgi:hypothetical protein